MAGSVSPRVKGSAERLQARMVLTQISAARLHFADRSDNKRINFEYLAPFLSNEKLFRRGMDLLGGGSPEYNFFASRTLKIEHYPRILKAILGTIDEIKRTPRSSNGVGRTVERTLQFGRTTVLISGHLDNYGQGYENMYVKAWAITDQMMESLGRTPTAEDMERKAFSCHHRIIFE